MEEFNLGQIVRGDTISWQFDIEDDNGDFRNISGNTFWMTLKDNIENLDDKASLQVMVDAPDNDLSRNGGVIIELPASETAKLDPGTYHFDLQEVIHGAEKKVKTLLLGEVEVIPDVTRSV